MAHFVCLPRTMHVFDTNTRVLVAAPEMMFRGGGWRHRFYGAGYILGLRKIAALGMRISLHVVGCNSPAHLSARGSAPIPHNQGCHIFRPWARGGSVTHLHFTYLVFIARPNADGNGSGLKTGVSAGSEPPWSRTAPPYTYLVAALLKADELLRTCRTCAASRPRDEELQLVVGMSAHFITPELT